MRSTVFMKEINKLIKRHGSTAAASAALSIKYKTLYAWSRGWRKPQPADVDDVTEKTGIPREKVRPDIFKPVKRRFA